MGSTLEAWWTTAVRALALLCAILLTIAVLEGRTVRRARAELQQLRAERDQAKSQAAGAWTRQSLDEAGQALRLLDGFYADPAEGFGRPGGLCSGNRLDDGAVVQSVIGAFLTARAAGQPLEEAKVSMRNAIRRTDAYRAVHPELALPADK